MEGYFAVDKKSKSKKIALASIATLAVIGIVATIYVCSASAPTQALSQYQFEKSQFDQYIQDWNKDYSESEYTRRFQIYRDNAAYIRVHNSQGKDWTLGVNEFADMTFMEFKNIYTPNKYTPQVVEEYAEFDPLKAVPTTVDWTTQGAVTAVKNQGQCGSCWSFSTTGSVEGAWFLAGHTLVSLSEQQLMDCSYAYGNLGCSGGNMGPAMDYVKANGGLTTEANYAYTGKDGICNKTKAKSIAASISGHKYVLPKNPTALYTAVAQQPITVSVEADQNAWQLYKGGIVTSDCGTALDHGVLIVGYSQVNSPPYWKVKNSWGAAWGEAGYIRIAVVAGDGLCGIQMEPLYPIV